MKKTRVIVLFGGRSAEHEVSLLSARNVYLALDRDRYEPVLVGIDKQGRWRREPEATLLGAQGDPRMLSLKGLGPEITVPVHPAEASSSASRGSSPRVENDLAASGVAGVASAPLFGPDDVVFPVLHGTYGEDGTVQGLLELADLAYVGAGPLGSAIGMDKEVAKRLGAQAGIPVVPWRVCTAADLRRDPQAVLERAGELGFPLFVKPANAGSSVGVRKVAGPDALLPALRAALAYDRKVLIEAAVDAREIECAVLGNDDPLASAPGEVVVRHPDGFYSYDAKYVDEHGADFVIPADLPDATSDRVRALAVATFRALELAGMARVDFFLDRKTGDLFVNEVNTIPGFTAISMYPKMWEASGLPLPDLVTRLVDLAVERRRERRALKTTL